MTKWAAYAAFEEEEKGTIEEGKYADFTILEEDLMSVEIEKIPGLKVYATYINGEAVYQRN